jgi:polyisoprenyl-teichoic acid--peptidoglycan teichoic acid transferase
MAAFVLVAVITGVLAFNFVYNLALGWNMTSLPGAPISQAGKPTTQATYTGNEPIILPTGPDSETPLQPADGPAPKAWDGVSRINILVMGLDYRDWEAGETPRTDTMILFTIDPLSKTAGMLSIPRDLWVQIPGYSDYYKINTAYFLGEANKLPGGGPALAAATVENFLGVPVHYYAQIDFGAFVKFINELGGIKLHIAEPITIYPIIDGKGKKILLKTGTYRVNGDYALAYARNRYTQGGDFDRSTRQQEVIDAIRAQILDFNMLPTLITKSPQIYKDLSSGVRTNLNLQQTVQLALLAAQIKKENIRHGVIGPDVVYNAFSPDGLSILIPIPDEIRIVRDEIFTAGGPVGPEAVSQDQMTLVKEEQARISVENGTHTEGLAAKTATYFKGLGLNVVQETSADQTYASSTIYIYNGSPYTIKYLCDLMKIDANRIYNVYDPDSQFDVRIVLGDDWASDNPIQ